MTMQINGSVGITFPDGTVQTTAAGTGAVSTVTAVSPLTSSGGANPAISLTGVVAPVNGGLGAASLTGLLYGNGAAAATPATGAQIAAVLGSTPIPTATNLAGGTANQIPVQSAAGTTTFVPAPTLGSTFLSWNGTAFQWVSSAASVLTFGTGFVAGSYDGSAPVTIDLDNTGVVAGTYPVLAGNFSTITVNAQGQITNVSDGPIEIDASQIISGILAPSIGGTGFSNNFGIHVTNADQLLDQSVSIGASPNFDGSFISVPGNNITGVVPPSAGGTGVSNFFAITTSNQNITLDQGVASGDAPVFDGTNFVSGTIPSTALVATGVTAATYGSATTIPVITVNAEGQITAATTATSVALTYQGTWDASGGGGGNPTLANGTGTQGSYYVCNVAGTANFGAGPVVFNVGDWAIYNGATWDQIANSQTTSVANFTITGIPANQLVVGNGTSPLFGLGYGASGQLLTSSGAGLAPTWQNAPTTVTSFDGGTTGLTPVGATTGAVTLGGTLAIANGGTNSTATPTAGGVAYGDGTAYEFTAAGTAGQVLTSNGVGAPTWAAAAGGITLASSAVAAAFYPTFSSVATGAVTTEYTSPLLSFQPFTGALTSQQFVSTAVGSGYSQITSAPGGGNSISVVNTSNTANASAGVSVGAGGGNLSLSRYSSVFTAAPTDFSAMNSAGVISVSSGIINITPVAGLNLAYSTKTLAYTITNAGEFLIGSTPLVPGNAGTAGQVLTSGGPGAPLTWGAASGGSVTSVSVVSANGLAGTVATATSTPAITLSTTVTGVLLGNGTAISAAAASDIVTLLGTTPVGTATNIAGGVANEIPYQTAAGTTAFIAPGTVGQLLTADALGVPTWANAPATGVTSFSAGTTGFTPSIATTGAVTLAGVLTPANGGTGVANTFTISVSNANQSLDQPVNSGAAPTFAGTNFTGTALSLTAGKADAIAGGLANQVLYQFAPDITAFLAAPTVANNVLSYDGTNLVWAAPTGGTATTATNLAGGAAGDIPWQSAANTTGFLAAGTSGQVLTSGGAAAPTWTTLGTMAAQNSNSVTITGGTINGTVIGGTTAAAVTGTTITANTQFTGPGTGLTGTAAGLSIGGNAATVTNGVYTTDTGTVTNTMLAGSIANAKLLNSSVTFNGVTVALGASGTITANTTNALTAGTGLTPSPAGTFNGSAAVTFNLADTAVAPGTYGSAVTIPVLTIDQQGRITAATTAISPALVYQGTWDASTNTPTLVNGTGVQGNYWVANAAGTVNFGAGPVVFNIGDWAIYDGAVWQSVANSQTTSVANFTITGIAANEIVLGGGASPLYGLGYGVAGQVLTSGGAGLAPTWSAASAGSVTSVDVSGGTTGLTTSGGPITTAGTITLAGTLNVANGGTGATTLTGYVKGTGTTAMTASATIPTTDLSGTVTNAQLANSAITVNGTSIALGASGTITAATTAAATFDNSGTGAVSGTTFDGSTARTISYNTVGASPLAGSTSLVTVGTITTGTWNGTAIANANLANSSVTINGNSVSLGGSTTVTANTTNTLTIGTGLSGTSFNGSAAVTVAIANTAVTAASYGSASAVATFTVNAQGQLTAAATTPIAIANTQVSGLGTMSVQNANAVVVTGGTIDGTTIGGTTAAAITGTTITATNYVGVSGGTF